MQLHIGTRIGLAGALGLATAAAIVWRVEAPSDLPPRAGAETDHARPHYRATQPSMPVDTIGRHGSVRLLSAGVVELVPDVMPSVRVLHARAVVTNDLDRVWAFDASAATVSIGEASVRHPAAVNGSARTTPLWTVERGDHAIVELYFPLGQAEPDPQRFDFAWQVTTAGGRVDLTSRFDAVDECPRGERPVLDAWRAWWFDPSYAWPVIAHRDGPLTSRTPAKAYALVPGDDCASEVW